MARYGLVMALFLAGAALAPAARADAPANQVNETKLRTFVKDKTKLAQVTEFLGAPVKTESNDEGLQAIAYLAPNVAKDQVAGASIFSAMYSPGGPEAKLFAAELVFDRNGVLLHWRGSFEGKAVTSEDRDGPLPNLHLSMAPDVKDEAPPDGGKPRLGIKPVPIVQVDPEYRAAFEAAHFDGLVVMEVLDGSTAQKGGIMAGDYLYVLNGTLVTTPEQAVEIVSQLKAGDAIKARVLRIDQNTSRADEHVLTLKF